MNLFVFFRLVLLQNVTMIKSLTDYSIRSQTVSSLHKRYLWTKIMKKTFFNTGTMLLGRLSQCDREREEKELAPSTISERQCHLVRNLWHSNPNKALFMVSMTLGSHHQVFPSFWVPTWPKPQHKCTATFPSKLPRICYSDITKTFNTQN